MSKLINLTECVDCIVNNDHFFKDEGCTLFFHVVIMISLAWCGHFAQLMWPLSPQFEAILSKASFEASMLFLVCLYCSTVSFAVILTYKIVCIAASGKFA